jgi:hypothetical protein
LSIFRDLLYADRDVIRVRSTDADDAGSISLEAGVELSFAALIDGRAQMVTAELLRDDYERAVEAHKNQNAISLTGELRREGQRWRLHNARQLIIIAGGEQDETEKDV